MWERIDVKTWDELQELEIGEFYMFIGDTVEEAVAKVEKEGREVKEVFIFGKQIRIPKEAR